MRSLGDYLGALLGSIAFSLLLMPSVGLVRTTALFGLAQLVAGFVVHRIVFGASPGVRLRWVVGIVVAFGLGAIWVAAHGIDGMTERAL